MAEASDCFEIGSVVSCVTCFQNEVQGEVIAYDPVINTISLKTASTSGKPSACDILFLNLKFTSHVKVLKEAPNAQLPPLPSLDLAKINERVKKSIEEKSKLLLAMQSGGTVEGQKLYHAILKTFDDLEWSGPNIIVMKQVVISPPYTLECVNEYKDAKDSNTKAVKHIRKIVEKFYNDQQTSNYSNSTNSVNSINNSAAADNGTSASSGSAQVQPLTQ